MTPPRTRSVTPAPVVAPPVPVGAGRPARTAKTATRASAPATRASAAGAVSRRRARRIGIMGGTFDPIHNGHLVAASEVVSRFLLDEVVFVPTGQPWQKADYPVSTAEDRYLMTVIATASNPRFHVSRVDIDRSGPTYTVDTLRDLRAVYGPKVDLFFITGADALDKILSWKDADQIFELAHLVGVTRPGFVLSDAHLPAATVSLVQVPAMAISSTDCRRRVAEGQPVWYLVPDGVVQYIAKRHLYRPAAGTP
jgi:nicotinate-nucleotide adenylyltransferase